MLLTAGLLTFGTLLAITPMYVHAEDNAVSEEQLKAVSQNCNTIKYTLTQLQKVDSRMRTYLGSAYEAISSKFITPLNLRLIRNNRESDTLFSIQSDFAAGQVRFRDAYTVYMREMEGLLAIDCQAHPQDFYRALESTRSKRAELKQTVERLNELAEEQYQAVVELKDDL